MTDTPRQWKDDNSIIYTEVEPQTLTVEQLMKAIKDFHPYKSRGIMTVVRCEEDGSLMLLDDRDLIRNE